MTLRSCWRREAAADTSSTTLAVFVSGSGSPLTGGLPPIELLFHQLDAMGLIVMQCDLSQCVT